MGQDVGCRERWVIGHQKQVAILLVHAGANAGQDVVGTLPVAGDDEHAEGLPAELARMLPMPSRCRVGEKLPLKAGLQEVAALHRHGAAIAFDEEGAKPAIGIADGEDMVGRHAELVCAVVTVDPCAHRPRRPSCPRVRRCHPQQLHCLKDLIARPLADRPLEGNTHVGDGQRMLDELPAGEIILARPVDVGRVKTLLDQQSRAAVGQRVHHGRRAAAVTVMLKLRPRPIEVAGMKEAS